MYVTAAALALQQDYKKDHKHWIEVPKRLVPIEPDPIIGKSGFQARAFLLYDKKQANRIEALIVAYTGSQSRDFWNDWIVVNAFGSQSQHDQARELLKLLSKKYSNIPKRVVTGFSLGGALAAHVALHPDTSKLVTEVWTFNPSGRIYDPRSIEEKIKTADSVKRDQRFWLVANYVEGVRYTRTNIARFVRGVDWIPAPYHQFINKVELINTNPVQGHYRYILFRDLMFAAEQDARIRGIPTELNEPLEILKNTHFSSCKQSS